MDKQKLNLELYKKVYLIRKSEETIIKYYMDDDMKTPVHLSVGEEAIAAGVVQATGNDDQIYGTYRNHGIPNTDHPPLNCQSRKTARFITQ